MKYDEDEAARQFRTRQLQYLQSKRNMLLREAGGLKTLVLGSSHGDYAFNPAFCPGAFNLCSRSQDFQYALLMYEKWAPRCPQLRSVVLFCSVFSPGFVLEKSPSQAPLAPLLNEVFSLGRHYGPGPLAAIADAVRGQADGTGFCLEGESGFFPAFDKELLPDEYGADKRAYGHLKYNRRQGGLPYLAGILQLSRDLGHDIHIVLSPARPDYRKALARSANELFDPLFKTLEGLNINSSAHVLNFFDSPIFSDADYGDFDHLHPLGAGVEKLSKEVGRAVALAAAQRGA